MLAQILIAFSLLALCVIVHALVMTRVLRWVKGSSERSDWTYWPTTWLLVRVASWAVFAHLLEIAIWGIVYAWREVQPSIEQAIYFSAVTYTTVGYGDTLPPENWRLVAGVEGLTGILMCGWSTGFFLVIANRMYSSREDGPGGAEK